MCNYDFCFCDQLLDPFVSKTIPIYYGPKGLNKFFHKNGILYFENIEELDNIIKNYVNKEYYYKNIKFIEYNYNKVKTFINYEDNIVEIVKTL